MIFASSKRIPLPARPLSPAGGIDGSTRVVTRCRLCQYAPFASLDPTNTTSSNDESTAV